MLTLVVAVGLALSAPSAAGAATDIHLTDIAGSPFTSPVYVTSPPADSSRVFVVELGGKVRMVKNGVVSDFLDLTSKVVTGGEGGLMSVAFPPDYATSRLFYAFYTNAGSCGTFCDDQVDEFHAASTFDTADPLATHDRPVIAIPHQGANVHHGGTLQFGADGDLYISTGDGHD